MDTGTNLGRLCGPDLQKPPTRGVTSSAAAYLTGRDEERAKQIAFDFLELLEKIDYNKYFESMNGVGGERSGGGVLQV